MPATRERSNSVDATGHRLALVQNPSVAWAINGAVERKPHHFWRLREVRPPSPSAAFRRTQCRTIIRPSWGRSIVLSGVTSTIVVLDRSFVHADPTIEAAPDVFALLEQTSRSGVSPSLAAPGSRVRSQIGWPGSSVASSGGR